MKTFLRYGVSWDAKIHPAQMELACIKRLGRWKDPKNGRMCGKGLPYHVKEFMKIAWPDMWQHRWVDLIIEEFLKSPGRTGCFGPSSSGKSLVFSRCALTMFYARPKGTTVLISSTTLDALKRRIWDYVVSSDKDARSRLPFLPGSLIESKLMLLADPSTEEGRSFKDGIVGVACFPSGTLVDTPVGKVSIESIKIGDKVLNATGEGVVSDVFSRKTSKLLRVKLSDGRIIDCTEEHPFFTQCGWRKARDLSGFDMVFSSHETMRLMQFDSFAKRITSEILPDLPEPLSGEVLRQLWKRVSPVEVSNEHSEAILREEMFEPMGIEKSVVHSCIDENMPDLRSGNDRRSREPELLLGGVSEYSCDNAMPDLREKVHFNQGITRKAEVEILQSKMSDGGYFKIQTPKECSPNSGRTDRVEVLPGVDLESSYQDRIEAKGREGGMVQNRSGFRWDKASSGNRRRGSQNPEGNDQGCKPNKYFGVVRVESVEVLESRCDERFNPSSGGYTVHNLEVEGHPSYSVNGVVVHNCKKGGAWQGLSEYIGAKNEVMIVVADELQFVPVGIVDALANLESNVNCYFAGMGNLPDVHNSLGTICEPKGGWDSLADTEKSRVYETKWRRGRCVQLIGMDSPNLDFPEGQEPYPNLIGRRYIEQCAQNYGRESDKFNMFASGKIPRASMNRTVFTKSMCGKFNASGSVTWGHNKVTRGYGMDAAYSGVGGDRTVGFPFVFGIDNTNRWKFWLGPMKVYPGSSSSKMSHSEAIAIQCKEECEAHGIPPEHLFYDGTGRSELTSAFARLWSPQVVPIEFGGPATERPSFTGERHLDGESAGDSKTCREVFDRFVTELWFAIRHCIVADQMRGLMDDAIEEGSQRKWELVRGNKYCIETKDDMKERGLRSPDIVDAVVVCLEGARRLGFPLGKHTPPNKGGGTRWLDAMREQEWENIKKTELVAA